MIAQSATRASMATQQIARRGFHSTRAQLSSPYHYPEGPRSNLPFNTKTRFFALRYWGFMGRKAHMLDGAQTDWEQLLVSEYLSARQARLTNLHGRVAY